MLRSTSGFSFIEVMAAMVILSISLVILMESQGRSTDLVGRARSLDFATQLAESKMTELTREVNEKGIGSLKDAEEGEFNQDIHPGYRWRYRVADVAKPDFLSMMAKVSGKENDSESAGEGTNAALFAGPLGAVADVWGKAIKELHLEVLWSDGNREKNFELVTQFIAPDAIAQIQAAIGGLTK